MDARGSADVEAITRSGASAWLHRVSHSRGPSLDYASEHIFERVSVAKDYEVKTEALRHGRGPSGIA